LRTTAKGSSCGSQRLSQDFGVLHHEEPWS
jgi:hypothetical protein